MKNLLLIVFFFSLTGLCAQQLTYKPKNPNFGGDTFNYQWLMSSADAQNLIEDPSKKDEEKSDLEEFESDLNRQILGQLTRNIFNSQLGDGLQEGTFQVGSLVLEIFDSTEGFVINILDTNTGEQTQVVVPN